MPKKIKKGKVGRPPSRHQKKTARTRKVKPAPPAPTSAPELTVEQESLIEDFARRVLKVRQIKGRRELFEQMNQIRKYLYDSRTYGDLS
jgi:ribosome-binding protein aMBF1 (putative translation factor)